MIASAANWLRLGQRVRIASAPVSIDGTTERRAGRVGVVWRLCSPTFADYVYVNLDLIGQERSEKVVLVELRDVEPIDPDATEIGDVVNIALAAPALALSRGGRCCLATEYAAPTTPK